MIVFTEYSDKSTVKLDPKNAELIPAVERAMNKTDCEILNEGYNWRPAKLSVMCSYKDIRVLRLESFRHVIRSGRFVE